MSKKRFEAKRVGLTTGGHQWQVWGDGGERYGCVDGTEAKTWADRLNKAREESLKDAASFTIAGALVNDRLLDLLRLVSSRSSGARDRDAYAEISWEVIDQVEAAIAKAGPTP